jgi:hypothetical protein
MTLTPLNMETIEEDTIETSEDVHHNLEVVNVEDTTATKLKTAEDVRKILPMVDTYPRKTEEEDTKTKPQQPHLKEEEVTKTEIEEIQITKTASSVLTAESLCTTQHKI